MQEQETQVISQKEFQQLILADQNIAWLEEFEIGGRSLLNRNSECAFRFSHYTIQEFLVAKCRSTPREVHGACGRVNLSSKLTAKCPSRSCSIACL
jgi:hypothetical protein